MPIHDQSYRHWDGKFKSHAFRWWVIAREGLRITLRHKLFLIFILAPSAITIIFSGAVIYGINVYGSLLQFNVVKPQFFFDFFMRQTFFIALICIFGGSGLIANDLKNNALQLYLSKSITRLDYLFGKFAIIVILMSFITVIPGILLFIEHAVLSDGSTFIKEQYWVLGSIILYSIFLTIPTGLLILALSSISKSDRYAAVGFIAILMGTPIFSEMLKNILKFKSAVFFSYWSNLDILGRRIFGIPSSHSWYLPAIIILSLCGACIWVMVHKVKGVEIVK